MSENPIERVSQTTPDLALEQVEQLKQLFPECVTEGRVDFDRLRATLGDGVQYLETGDNYEMSLFEELEGYEDSLLPIEKSIYDHVIYDSKVERGFAEALEEMDEVKLFIKLPNWFTVPTPIGDYNPDWAIVFYVQDAFGETREKLYLVRETKGRTDEASLRGLEEVNHPRLKVGGLRESKSQVDQGKPRRLATEDMATLGVGQKDPPAGASPARRSGRCDCRQAQG